MTELTNNLRYFDLQRQLWQYHYDLGLKEGRWEAQLLNKYAKQHNTCRAYSYLKHVIEKRLVEEFNYKKKMIVMNSNDHYLIRSFYYLQLNEEQVDKYIGK